VVKSVHTNKLFPLNIPTLFDKEQGEKALSKIELRSIYHQVRIKYDDIHKMDFRKTYRHYDFMVVPFGLVNTLATFMCLMRNIFIKYLDNFLLVFMMTSLSTVNLRKNMRNILYWFLIH
jgi:hypothetical protein